MHLTDSIHSFGNTLTLICYILLKIASNDSNAYIIFNFNIAIKCLHLILNKMNVQTYLLKCHNVSQHFKQLKLQIITHEHNKLIHLIDFTIQCKHMHDLQLLCYLQSHIVYTFSRI